MASKSSKQAATTARRLSALFVVADLGESNAGPCVSLEPAARERQDHILHDQHAM